MLELSEASVFYAEVDYLGSITEDDTWIDWHVNHVHELELVLPDVIKAVGFKVAVDAVNSSGGIPQLLRSFGCEVVEVNCEPTGHFAHNPEPLPSNLTDLSEARSK